MFKLDPQTSNMFANALGGFSGAFFALIFLGVSGFVKDLLKRKKTHYNSLVILETELNEIIGIIKDNLFLLPPFKDAIKKGNIYWSKIKTIPVNKSHLFELADIEIINELFEFDYKVRKINDDIESLMTGYSELKDAYIHKYIKVTHYIQNAEMTSEHLGYIEIFLEDLEKDLIDLLVKIRIQIRKDKPWIVSMQEFFNTSTSDKVTIQEYKKEKSGLEKELEESTQKSREEIARIIKKKK